ncbi:protein translocase subunit SecDF [uncultured Mucilaginibacter sp.]|uniref:protein translocase subunit SecDF n=1 Tax=uncultured Mucilaginibacter sp. TaxID=797541 RepID=UPI0026393411|nr:protein translocase subunit SecDF [uncultured Mucilaginibacter sp.]
MQSKGVIKFFAIVLAIVCLYQLSFTWVAHHVESNAKIYAKGNPEKETAYLDSISTQPVYPVFNHTYQYCKEKELALGLDLKGGMNVTMQISLAELVKSLSDNNTDPAFNQALSNAEARSKTSQQDYITLFVNEYEKLNPNGKLAPIFSTKESQSRIKFDASNNDVKRYLQDEAKSAVDRSYNILRTRIDKFGVTAPNIQLQSGTNRILIELPGVSDANRVRKLLQGSAKLEFYETFDNSEILNLLGNINNILAAKAKAGTTTKDTTVKTALAKTDTSTAVGGLLNKVAKSKLADTSAKNTKTGNPAVNSPLLNQNMLRPNVYASQDGGIQPAPGPVVGFAAVGDTAKVDRLLNSPDVKSVIPQNVRFLWGVKALPVNDDNSRRFNDKIPRVELYAIKLSGADGGPVLAGDVIADARNDYDQKGSPEVQMTMNTEGAAKWRTVTAAAAADQNNKKAIAIVLDDYVYSAPTVQNEISGGVSSISGSFTVDDTKDLANVLKAGRLPAPARIVEEAIVGPSLGQEAINAGLISCVVGLLVVLVFMIAYYNRAGSVAVVAVFINVFFLFGVLASLGAVLTLPGIAGIVLTLGISVDANVLIYERVREEMAHGKSVRIAVADGFKHAMPSILDSNITTFLTGIILYIFGSGPILGFATTLLIGIITSLFCSLLISRLIFEWMLEKGWDIKFSYPWSDHTFKNAHYAFVKNRFKFYTFSGLFILAGLISIITRGFSLGVDFKGGRTYVVRFEKPVDAQQVRDALDKTYHLTTEVKTFGTTNPQLRITTPYLVDDNSPTADTKAESKLKEGLHLVNNPSQIMSQQKVGPTIASDIKTSAFYSVVFAILIVSLYILIRFRKWQFSLGALIATAHDALLVLSFFSLFNGILPFSLDIDQAFIAAILTVIGYSINDTVVVFDRIREFLNLHNTKADDQKVVINNAINSTLSRTVITALTVIFVLIVLFVFGGEVIRGFSFALLIGVIFGTYSSICVATPVIVDFGKKDLK